MGGAWFQDVFSQSPTESEVEQTALDAVGHSLGMKQNPTMCHVTICKVCKCIKPYAQGFQGSYNLWRQACERVFNINFC